MKQKLQNILFLFIWGTIGAKAQGPVITAAGCNPKIGESCIWAYTRGYKGIPLTLQISSFTASLQNKLPYLQWSATNTENTKTFIIQRSVDGNTFSNVGQVARQPMVVPIILLTATRPQVWFTIVCNR